MPSEVLMPALSPTMKSGNISKWLKSEGEKVKAGEVIAEIETDKAIMELESPIPGILGKVVIPEKTKNVPVGALVAIILSKNDNKSVVDSILKKAGTSKTVEKQTSASKKKMESASTEKNKIQKPNAGRRLFATPLAKKIAREKHIDLTTVTGTGPKGRIIKQDLENFSSKEPLFTPSHEYIHPILDPHEVKECSENRKITASRLQIAKQTIPHFYMNIEFNIEKLLAYREKNNTPSINDIIIKLIAETLKEHPEINVAWMNGKIAQFKNIDIAIAVKTGFGLITPIIRNADKKTMEQITKESKELIKKARENKLSPKEFQGGSFSISNLGMYKIKNFSAIINPPQSGILAVGCMQQKMISSSECISFMEGTFSFDHRTVDGGIAAEFARTFTKKMETIT